MWTISKKKKTLHDRHNLQNKYNRYAFIFFSCEVLNFVIVLGQVCVSTRIKNIKKINN